MDKKDQLIKQLQSQVKSLESEKANSEQKNFVGYSCAKCGNLNNMSFTLNAIRNSGLCPHCYNESK